MSPTPDFPMDCWISLRNSNCCSASSNCPCISWQRIIPVTDGKTLFLPTHLPGQAHAFFSTTKFSSPQPLHKAVTGKEWIKTYGNGNFAYSEKT